jgi:type I restriction enzyme S subunit
MNSDALWDYANSNAAGTMSKRVKWRDLAEYEFLLPPKEEQAKLAELLWTMDEVIEKEKGLLINLENSYMLNVDYLFSNEHKDWKYIPLGEISYINSKSLTSKIDPSYEFHYLDLASILEPKVIGELKKIRFGEAPSRAKRIVNDKSIVLAMVRPYQKAFVFVENGKDLIASTGTSIINMHDDNLAHFVFHQFFSKRFSRYCEDRMTGTNYPAITPKDLFEFKVSIPNDIKLVKTESKKMEDFDIAISVIKKKIERSKSLQKSLINQVF